MVLTANLIVHILNKKAWFCRFVGANSELHMYKYLADC